MLAEQETALEQALRLAADAPAQRPEFFRLLLESPVYILGDPSSHDDGSRACEPGEKISILNWVKQDGSPVIPFFSSLPALQRAVEEESRYIELPARSLFEMTRGSALFLDPKSQYGKEFVAAEIEALLTNGMNRLPEQRVTKEATRVLLGQPANHPARMVDSLAAYLAKNNNVKAAYLALMHDPSQSEKPHLVVGIEADGDIERIVREAGVVAGDTAPNGETVDLFRVERGQAGLSDYFCSQVQPFYRRTWARRLKALLRSPTA